MAAHAVRNEIFNLQQAHAEIKQWLSAGWMRLVGPSAAVDRRVLIQLSRWLLRRKRALECSVPVFRLAQECGIAVATAVKALRRMEGLGLLKREEDRGIGWAAVYTIVSSDAPALGPQYEVLEATEELVPKDHAAFTRGALGGGVWMLLNAMARGLTTRRQLLDDMAVSTGSMTHYIQRAMEYGLVKRVGTIQSGGRGRPTDIYELTPHLLQRLDQIAVEKGVKAIKARRAMAWKFHVEHLKAMVRQMPGAFSGVIARQRDTFEVRRGTNVAYEPLPGVA